MESDTEWDFPTKWTTFYDLGKDLILEKRDSDIIESYLKLTHDGLIDACTLIEAKISLRKVVDPLKGKKKSHQTDDGIFILQTQKGFPVWNSENKFKDIDQLIIQDVKYVSKNGKYYVTVKNDGRIITNYNQNGLEGFLTEFYDYNSKIQNKYPPFYVIKRKSNSLIQVIDSKNQIFYEVGPFNCGDCILMCNDKGFLELIDSKGKVYWQNKK